jgi:hypothetical protein
MDLDQLLPRLHIDAYTLNIDARQLLRSPTHLHIDARLVPHRTIPRRITFAVTSLMGVNHVKLVTHAYSPLRRSGRHGRVRTEYGADVDVGVVVKSSLTVPTAVGSHRWSNRRTVKGVDPLLRGRIVPGG